MNIIEEKKLKFTNAINHLTEQFKQIRTGRANSGLIENLMVESYGSLTPLQQLANISVPDSRSIVIQPWDKNIIKDIEKAIQSSNLGLTPINEGQIIRLPIPQLTEERRKELSKIVHEKSEEARISIRNIREEIWKSLKDQKNDGKISEDEMFKLQKELQKIIDDNNDSIKVLSEKKENEIMTI